jgi:hypothetical protein
VGDDLNGLRTHFRFARFRLRTLFLLPVLFAIAWWWLTWPDRTARQFVRLLSEDVEAAKAMIDGPQPSAGFWKIVESRQFEFETPTFQPQSWAEYFSAWREFHFDWETPDTRGDLGPFVAARSRVMPSPEPSVSYLITYDLGDLESDSFAGHLQLLYTEADDCEFRVEGQSTMLIGAPQQVHGEVNALRALFATEPGPQGE